jgi:hypothetical protein
MYKECIMLTLPIRLGRADLRYAQDADLVLLVGDIDGRPGGDISRWHFVSIAADGDEEVHCLGWQGGDVYITSPVRAYDLTLDLIRTRSGSVYRLRNQVGSGDLAPPLARHLIRALLVWRYASREDVR